MRTNIVYTITVGAGGDAGPRGPQGYNSPKGTTGYQGVRGYKGSTQTGVNETLTFTSGWTVYFSNGLVYGASLANNKGGGGASGSGSGNGFF